MVASTREANANAKLAGFSVGKVPTERDFAVYRRVAIERVTTREAAQEFSLSQTRVCQIVEQMVQWLATELTAAADGMEEKGRIAVAKHIAASRMDYLYGEAVDAWKTSQKQETWSRQTRMIDGRPVVVETSRREQGNVRYLAAAARICQQMAKLPAAHWLAGAPSDEEFDIESESEIGTDEAEQLSAEQLSEQDYSAAAAAPPVEDCSARDASPAEDGAFVAEDSDITYSAAEICVESAAAELPSDEAIFGELDPVQRSPSDPTQGERKGDPTGDFPRPHSTRRERRALRKRMGRSGKVSVARAGGE